MSHSFDSLQVSLHRGKPFAQFLQSQLGRVLYQTCPLSWISSMKPVEAYPWNAA